MIVKSAKPAIESLKLAEEVNDDFFNKKLSNRERKDRKRNRGDYGEERFFKQGEKLELDEDVLAQRKVLQEQVDDQLMDAISKVPLMKEYLKDLFGLKHGQAPHRMVF